MGRPSSSFRSIARWFARACVYGSLALFSAHCVQALQSYPLRSSLANATEASGQVSVERIEGGLRLVVVQLSQLPAPERIAPGLTEFVVWLLAPGGDQVKAGALNYDRDHRSGSLFATTSMAAFTVQVTGERDPSARTPSGVVLAERAVTTN